MNKVTKKKRGRPTGSTVDNPRSTQLPVVRVTPNELKTYKAAAEAAGTSFSAWVRNVLDKASR